MDAHLASCHLQPVQPVEIVGPLNRDHASIGQAPIGNFEMQDVSQHQSCVPAAETSVNSSLDSSFDRESPDDLENSLNSSCSEF